MRLGRDPVLLDVVDRFEIKNGHGCKQQTGSAQGARMNKHHPRLPALSLTNFASVIGTSSCWLKSQSNTAPSLPQEKHAVSGSEI
jgi:hypothetical protein